MLFCMINFIILLEVKHHFLQKTSLLSHKHVFCLPFCLIKFCGSASCAPVAVVRGLCAVCRRPEDLHLAIFEYNFGVIFKTFINCLSGK